MNCYQQKAHATQSRKRAAGGYASQAHKNAFAKLMQRGGMATLTAQECALLATDPRLTFSQREAMAALAEERA